MSHAEGLQGRSEGATDGELDVAQLAGHSVAVVRVGAAEEVLAGSEEPAEGDDGKVDDVGPAHAKLGSVAVEHFDEGPEDGDVDRVGARARTVFLLEACAALDPGRALGWRCDVKGVLGAPGVGSTHCEDLAACRIDFPKCG